MAGESPGRLPNSYGILERLEKQTKTCPYIWYEHENIRSVGANGRVSVNVWGAITYAGLGPLFRNPGRLTAEVDNEIIDDVLLAFAINGTIS
ncbi:hypothetical protein MRX96_045252 [Rhipicephalus microplus]